MALRHWEREFAEHREHLPGMADLRRAAFERFTAAGFPGKKTPGWRHTNVAPLSRIAFELDKPPVDLDPAVLPTLEGAGLRAVFVDGRFRQDLSSPGLGLDGARVGSLRAEHALVEKHLAGERATANGSLVDLNTAFLEDGALVIVEPGVRVAEALHLLFVSTGREEPVATVLRTLVLAGRQSEVRVVEHHLGLDGSSPSLTSAVTDVHVAAGAQVTHLRLQEEAPETYHLGEVRVQQARDSRFHSYSFALGAKLSRTGIHATLAEPGAECDLHGLYLGRDRQHHDHTTIVRHAAPHATSRELYKGLLDDHSRGVFTGIVQVDRGADKTIAEQSNRNLVLSDGAHADSEPQLEIHADDVKCSHGSAIGQVDEDALFYLRARGIDLRQARVLLTRAFAREVTDAIVGEGLRGELEARVDAWLDAATFGESA